MNGVNQIDRFSLLLPSESQRLLNALETKVKAATSQAFENQEAAIRECWEVALALPDMRTAIKACKICARTFPSEGTITFQFEEGEVTLPVYFRDILAKMSRYFYALLKGKFSEARSTHITLTDVDVAYFKTLVELLEHGEEALKDLEVEDLFNFAEQARIHELHTLATQVEGVMVKKLDSLEISDIFLFVQKMATLERSFLVNMAKRALYHKIRSFKKSEETLAKTYEILNSLSIFKDDKEILEAISDFHLRYTHTMSCWEQEALLTSHGYNFLALQLGVMQGIDYKDTLVLTHCPNLRKLVLTNIDITESPVREVASSCPSLQELSITWCNHFDGEELAHFAVLPALRSIKLTSCSNLTDDGLKSLVTLTSLKELNIELSFNTDTVTGACLSNLTQLQSLSFDGCPRDLTGFDLCHLNSLTALRRLSLFVGKLLTIQHFESLASLSALEDLELKNFTNLQDGDLTHLTIFPRLQVLSLDACHNLHSVASLTALTALRTLEVIFSHLTSGLADIQPLTTLRKLNLYESFGFNDDDLHRLTSLAQLESLQLTTSTTFIGEGLMQLAPLTNLQNLTLSGNSRDSRWLALESRIPYLKMEL